MTYDEHPERGRSSASSAGREGRAVFIYWLAVLLLVISYLVARGLVKSRVGRSLVAIRDNETAAAVMGVPRARTKTVVFGISAAMCAIAGSLSTIRLNLASPDIRNITLIGSITFLLIMVLGGAATLWGPIVGALAYVMHRRQDTRGRRDRRGHHRHGLQRLAEHRGLAGDADPGHHPAGDDVRRPVRHRRTAQAHRSPSSSSSCPARRATRSTRASCSTTTEAAADVDGVAPEPDANVFVADPSTTPGEPT